MPYYGDGLPYYYGAPFANHSSLMTGTARTLHTPYSRFSPHLSTITESPLSNLRRYNPVTVSPRPKRVIDTADIDVSTPRILSRETNNHQRNRLRRDRPTIKIRSQALKDNPALREHNERHEKSVGELLVEKFLIKDKKQKLETDTERRLRVFHQVSLDRSDDLVVKSKITRRFTRRRSSADIQLDPAQLEREVAYAQVQAEVLDTLVAEEQAEIENEVRRGTLIRKSTIGGPRTVPSFFRNLDRDSHDEEDEAAAHRNRKNLKKVKKRKKTTEKPSPPDEEGSTSSDVSVDYEAELEDPKPQMYKIEASNSAGDFSTVWLNAPEPRNPEAPAPEESDLETVVLAVRKPYVKDTSRNSVYFTVKSPESVKPPENGVDVAASPGKELGKQTKKKSILKKKLSEKVPCDEEVAEKPEVDGLKAAPTTQGAEEASVVSTVDGGENSGSASVARLPKESKINTDENNAVEAPELSLGEAKYLAKPTKNERDEDIPLPGKNKAPTLAKKPPAGTVGGGCEQEEKLKEETGATGSEKIAIERTTLIEGKTEGRDFDEEKGETKKVGGALRAKETGRTKSEGTGGEEPKFERNDVEKSRGGISKFAKVESKGSPTTEVDKTSKVQWKKGAKELVVAKKEAGDVSSKKEVEEKAKDSLPGSPKIEVNVESKFPWRKGPAKEPVAPKPAETKIVNDLKEVSEVGKSKECSPSSPKTEVNAESKFPWRKGPAKEPVAPKPAETKIVNDLKEVSEVGKSKECSPSSPKTEANAESKFPWRKGPAKEPVAPKPAETKIVNDLKEVPEVGKSKECSPSSPKTEANAESKFPWRKGPAKEPVAPKPAETKIVNDSNKVPELEKSKECSPSSPKIEVNSDSKFPWRKGPAKEPVAPKPAETKIVNDSNKVPEVEKSKECSPTSPKTEVNSASKIPWKKALPKLGKEQTAKNSDKTPTENSPKLEKTNLPSSHQPSTEGTTVGKLKFPNKTQPRPAENIVEPVKDDTGSLSKSTSTESIDFWSEIKAPDSPQVTKPKTPATSPFSKIPEDPVNLQTALEPPKASVERSATGEPMKQPDSNKKETDLKISVGPPAVGVGNPVLESEADLESSKPKTEEETVPEVKKEARRNKNNLSITIDPYSTIKKTPLKREDSTPTNSVQNTPETAIPAEAPTPVPEDSLPTINIVPAFARSDSQVDDDEDPTTPTNEWADVPARISKWSNQGDLSNVDAEKDVTPVASKSASVLCSPEDSPESSKKKKVVKKKKGSKSSTMKSSATKSSTTKSGKTKKSSVVEKEGSQGSLKPPERKSSPRTSPRNSPTQRPIDLIRMFYTTPTALLTATPRDLSKVRRAKIKRRKHQSRTPSVSSDSTGSTTSTATGSTGSGSTCTELDDDPEHKRMNSTRSNDSGFDGSPRISTPSQSSDAQRNSDSSDHFPSGRITPPATNLPRFKKYAVTDFNFLKVLGKGSFGKVLLAELRGTECVYAVKCLKKDVVLEDDDVECTLIERKVLTLATRHPYLCHLFCTFQTDSHLFFVMEYLNGGDLMFHIQKSGRFPEPRARFYAAEIWSGLNFLHKKGIVYRDLKLDNVLLDYEGHIRIADFGMCKLQIFLDRTADTFCGTPDYMAPEIIKGLKYNQAVDWWSYGVLLYEMLTGQSPFSGCDEDELFWSICNERPFIPRYLSQEATDILVCLLEKDSGKRLPGHDIAYHAFFQQLPWDRLERRQMEAPFKPAVDHTLDTRYFDTAFTAERPRLTPVPDQILTSMDQGVFRGFSYTNPNATD